MQEIHKQILTDEAGRPIAIQIAYRDWLDIENQLRSLPKTAPPVADLMMFSGKLNGGEEPLSYQHRMREEWET